MNSNNIEEYKLSYLTLKLTNRCNLHCVMCGQVYGNLREQEEDLNYEIIKERLKSNNDIKTVYLFGGEPLLYKKFVPLIKLLQEKSIDTLISTNGTLLDLFIDDLIKYQVRDLSISLDSMDEKFCDEIRGKGVYKKVFENIRKLIDTKKKANSEYPYIGINCVILKKNYKKLVEFYNFMKKSFPEIARINYESPMAMTEELGRKHEQVMRTEFNCDPISWKWFFNKINSYNKEELNVIYNQIEALKKKEKATFQAPTCYEDIVNSFTEEYKIPSRICIYPFSMLAILPNGDVTYCVDFPDYIVGNIYKDTFEDIFKGEKSDHIREYLKENNGLPICARCPHRFDTDEFLIKPVNQTEIGRGDGCEQ